MESDELILQVDPRLTFSVNAQIKEQLKWLIGTGRIQPGDRLPSANQLADSLGINRNTVNLVYTQLRDEGLLDMHKGRGTEVRSGAKIDRLRSAREPMSRLAEKTVEEAERMGIDPTAFFTAGLAYILLRDTGASSRVRLLFVECRQHDHPFYRGEIERVMGGDVRIVFLEDLSADSGRIADLLAQTDLVVTTLNHAEETKELFGRYDRKVLVIGATVEAAALLDIARLEAGSSVGFVCLGRAGGEWMAGRVRDAGIAHIRAESVGLDEGERLESCLANADKVYASGAVFDELKTRAADKVELYPMKLEMSSESLLEEWAASAGPGGRPRENGGR